MYAKIIQSGLITETYEYQKAPTSKGPTVGTKREKSKRHLWRRIDNIGRLRKNFRRLIWANLVGSETPYLVTLTMLQVLPVETSSGIFTEFFAFLRRSHREIRYIAVPEFQKRGAIHFHVILWGLNEICATEKTDRYLQSVWQRGFVDCIPTDGSDRLGSYLAKYMSKALQDVRLLHKKAYFTSHNVLRPVSYGSKTLNTYFSEVINTGDLVHSSEFVTQWLGRSIYKKYKAKQHAPSNSEGKSS